MMGFALEKKQLLLKCETLMVYASLSLAFKGYVAGRGGEDFWRRKPWFSGRTWCRGYLEP